MKLYSVEDFEGFVSTQVLLHDVGGGKVKLLTIRSEYIDGEMKTSFVVTAKAKGASVDIYPTLETVLVRYNEVIV